VGLNQLEEAIAEYERILRLDPENQEARILLATLYAHRRQFPKAIGMVKEILKRRPHLVVGYYHLGRLHLEMGQVKEAKREFRRTLQMDPKFVPAMFALAVALGQPRYRDQVHYYIGLALEEKGDLEGAAKEYLRVGRGSEQYIPAHLRLAYVYFQTKRRCQAQALLEELKAMAPQREEIYLAMSYFYEEEGLWHRATAALLEGLTKVPKSVEMHLRLAYLYEKQKQREESIRHIQKVLKLDPDNAEALNFLGYTYAEAGIHLDEAERLIKAALRLKPDSGHIIDSLGWVYYQKGLYDQAVVELERAFEKIPTDATVAEHLGDAYCKQRRYRKALEMYHRALKLENPEVGRLQQKIRDLELRLQQQEI